MTGTFVKSADYAAWLGGLKSRIRSARISAARAVNRELILLYWDIGRGIVEKQEDLGWGKSVVEQLALDLRSEFPGMKGFSANNLWLMRQFYSEYSSPSFLEQLVQEMQSQRLESPEGGVRESVLLEQLVQEILSPVPWGHLVEIAKKVKVPRERLYYLRATAQLGWTRAVLMNQIKADAHGRSLAEGKAHNFPLALPEHLAEQAEEALKSSYNLEFLGIGREIKERELKIGEFQPEFAGKMDFYLNVLNEKERATDDNPSIGIILCAEKDDVAVEFALKSKVNPIGVAEYQLKPTLPKALKGKLPTAKELGAAIGLPAKRPGGAKNR